MWFDVSSLKTNNSEYVFQQIHLKMKRPEFISNVTYCAKDILSAMHISAYVRKRSITYTIIVMYGCRKCSFGKRFYHCHNAVY